MSIIEVNDNIFNFTGDVICHQTNCQGVMGHGIALQVKERFPEVFNEYKEMCRDCRNVPESLLGNVLFSKTKTAPYEVANIFGQVNYGEGLQTDYAKLKQGFIRIKNHLIAEGKTSVAIPYKIGCGLAHGDWNIVYEDIKDVFDKSDIKCYIYKYERNEKY